MKVTCPSCQTPFPEQRINQAADLAYCPSCQETFLISLLMGKQETGNYLSMEGGPQGYDPQSPPPKVHWNVANDQVEITIDFPRRFLFILLPPSLLYALAAIFLLLQTLYKGELILSNLAAGIFGLFLGGAFSTWTTYFLWGKTKLSVNKRGIRLFDGLGPLNKRRFYSWDGLTGFYNKENEGSFSVHISGVKQVSLAKNLQYETANYLISALGHFKRKYSPRPPKGES
jgi:hypothetical protein